MKNGRLRFTNSQEWIPIEYRDIPNGIRVIHPNWVVANMPDGIPHVKVELESGDEKGATIIANDPGALSF